MGGDPIEWCVMRSVVIYESKTGNTERAARLIAKELVAAGHEVAVFPTKAVDLKTVADADLIIAGTWVDGLILFGHRPGGAGTWVKYVPEMWDKPTFAFMTYAARPGNAIGKFSDLLRALGCDVRGGLELHRKHLDTDAVDFTAAVLDAVAKVPV